jgi:hypothetical protein
MFFALYLSAKPPEKAGNPLFFAYSSFLGKNGEIPGPGAKAYFAGYVRSIIIFL